VGPSGSPVSSPLTPSRQHGFTIVVQVPGYWPSLDTPHGLDVHTSDLRGLLARTYAIRRAALVTFTLATDPSKQRPEVSPLHRLQALRPPGGGASSAEQNLSPLQTFQRLPSIETRSARPLPGGLPPIDPRCQPRTRSALAVPPGFGVLLRAPPAGLLHPAPDHGVRFVSGLLP
jgi:hypothetical protein